MFINISLRKNTICIPACLFFFTDFMFFSFFKKKKDTKTCYITIINKVNDTIMKLFSGFV